MGRVELDFLHVMADNLAQAASLDPLEKAQGKPAEVLNEPEPQPGQGLIGALVGPLEAQSPEPGLDQLKKKNAQRENPQPGRTWRTREGQDEKNKEDS